VNVLISPLSSPGYLYPAIAIGVELQRRGVAVHVLGTCAAARTAGAAGLAPLPAVHYGAPIAFSTGRWFRDGAAQFKAASRAAQDIHADAIITSVLCHGALLAAEMLDIPAVVIGLAAHLWTYLDDRPDATRTRREGICLSRYVQAREEVGLLPRGYPAAPLLGAGLLLRGAPELEEPGAVLPAKVHHVGPCFWEPPADEPELAEIDACIRTVGKPAVYTHLGRYFGGTNLWPTLDAAFAGGPYQAIVEQGRSADPRAGPHQSADIIRVRKPWMLPLIDRAQIVLTNATSAPVLAALLRGRPLVVAPEGSEQPLLARACVRAGVAIRLGPTSLYQRPRGGFAAVAALVAASTDAGLRARARQLGAKLIAMAGPAAAADVVFRAVAR
jgi:UDP:flavonoid glycosyltransferase YjiC (YdhE family)